MFIKPLLLSTTQTFSLISLVQRAEDPTVFLASSYAFIANSAKEINSIVNFCSS